MSPSSPSRASRTASRCPKTKSENRLLEISKTSLAHGVDEVLIGAKVGEENRKTRTYAADYEQKDLAGKTIEWRANVKEIYKKELPPLDDDFAKDQGDIQSLAELRDRVRTDLLTHAKSEADARARAGLLDLVLDRNKIEVPESLVTREQRAMESELASTLRQAGMPRRAGNRASAGRVRRHQDPGAEARGQQPHPRCDCGAGKSRSHR